MAAIYSDNLAGTVSDNPLTSGATTLNSAALEYMPAVTAPDFMYIVLDPLAVDGLPEIVKVTAHTAAATSATITRGQAVVSNLTSTGREHAQDTVWVHGLTKADANDLPHRLLTTAGDVLYASAANTPARLAIGTTGQRLSVVGGVPAWASDTANTVVDAAGDLLVGSAADTLAKLAIGSAGTRLGSNGTTAAWVADTANTVADTKGDLIVATAADTVAALPAGDANQILVPDSGETTGLKYVDTGETARGVNVRLTSNGAFTASSPTAITWSTEVADASGFISVLSQTLTVPAGCDGIYMFTVNCSAQSISDALRVVAGGVDFRAVNDYHAETATWRMTVTGVVVLAEGNTIQAILDPASSTVYGANLTLVRLSL